MKRFRKTVSKKTSIGIKTGVDYETRYKEIMQKIEDLFSQEGYVDDTDQSKNNEGGND